MRDVKPLDLSNALKHAFVAGRRSAGVSSYPDAAWPAYDPMDSAAYARVYAALAASAISTSYAAGLEKVLNQYRSRLSDMARHWEAEAQLLVRIDAAMISENCKIEGNFVTGETASVTMTPEELLYWDGDVGPDAPDVRVVTVAQLERWIAYADDGLVSTPIKEMRAIIGEPK